MKRLGSVAGCLENIETLDDREACLERVFAGIQEWITLEEHLQGQFDAGLIPPCRKGDRERQTYVELVRIRYISRDAS